VQYHLSRLTPFVKVENLGNVRYEEVVGYQPPGRRVILGVKL
jgi:outer membrane cobalamin receptor